MFYEGEVAERLAAIFCARWEVAGGDPIAPLPSAANHSFDLRASVDVHTPEVAIARTVSRTDAETAPPTYEIHALYTDAIAAAEGLIYIETQYLTSRAICQALEARMSEPRRSKLQIVIVLPKHAEALKEEVALGVKQTERLRSLAETARRTGHALGVYYTVAAGGEVPIYIHSKLLVIDRSLHDRGLGELHQPQPLAGSRAQLGLGVDAGRGRRVCQHSRFAGSASVRALRSSSSRTGATRSLRRFGRAARRVCRDGQRMSAHPSARINRASRA